MDEQLDEAQRAAHGAAAPRRIPLMASRRQARSTAARSSPGHSSEPLAEVVRRRLGHVVSSSLRENRASIHL